MAAETIDSLLVSLGLDVDAKSFQKATDAITDVKNKSLQLLSAAGIGVGFGALTTGLVGYTNEIRALGRATQNSEREIEAFRSALGSIGGGAEADAILRNMTNLKRQVAMGDYSVAGLIPGLTEEMIKDLPVIELFDFIAKQIRVMDKGMQTRALTGLGAQPGSAQEQFLTGRRDFETSFSEAMLRVSGITQELGSNVDKFNGEVNTLRDNFTELSKVVGGPLLREINGLTEVLNTFVKENKKEITEVATDILTGTWYDKIMGHAEKLRKEGATMLFGGGDFAKWLDNTGYFVTSDGEVFVKRDEAERHQDQINARGGITSIGAVPPFAQGAQGAATQFAQGTNTSSRQPLGMRNRNPGNLRFAGQAGATRGEGGFASFQSQEAGLSALHRQLGLYFKRGKNTIAQIVRTYAPAEDSNDVPAYINALTKATGKGANEPLNFEDANMMTNLIQGIVNQEVGRGHIGRGDIERAIGAGAAGGGYSDAIATAGGQFSSPEQTLPSSGYSPSTQPFPGINQTITITTGANPDDTARAIRTSARNAADYYRPTSF